MAFLWHSSLNRSVRLHCQSSRSSFYMLFHSAFMCPLLGASELLDWRHANIQDFRFKAVVWKEKLSACHCTTRIDLRAAQLEGFFLLWVCNILHIYIYIYKYFMSSSCTSKNVDTGSWQMGVGHSKRPLWPLFFAHGSWYSNHLLPTFYFVKMATK